MVSLISVLRLVGKLTALQSVLGALSPKLEKILREDFRTQVEEMCIISAGSLTSSDEQQVRAASERIATVSKAVPSSDGSIHRFQKALTLFPTGIALCEAVKLQEKAVEADTKLRGELKTAKEDLAKMTGALM